jgi:hypothetical protein
MSTTPRTDTEHAKTLTPAYEYEGAEHEAWEWARKLEKELAKSIVLEIRDWTPERWKMMSTIAMPAAVWISGEQMERLMWLMEEYS